MMGANQSTRKLNVKNESPIHVSEAAMKRMSEPETIYVNTENRPQPLSTANKLQQIDTKGGDEFWNKRVDEVKKAHQEINRKIEEEYGKAVEETKKLFYRNDIPPGAQPPCTEYRSMVIKCYKENPTQPLLCAKYVADFNDCVSHKRSEKIMATRG